MPFDDFDLGGIEEIYTEEELAIYEEVLLQEWEQDD